MYDLQLRKGGVLVAKEWDLNARDYIERPIENEDVIFHLGDSVCLDRGVVLMDLFSLISRDVELWSIITSCPFLDEFMEEAKLPPVRDEDVKDIAFLELGWRSYITAQNGRNFITECADFHGMGSDKIYAVEFTPLNKLISLPFILNEEYKIFDDSDDECEKFSAYKKFSLGRMVKEVVFELSFVGPPSEKSATFEEIKQRHQKFQDGESEGISWEEVEKKFDKDKEKYAKPCKKCGKDSRSPTFNKPPGICDECFKRIREN